MLESSFLDLVPFMDIEGNAYKYNEEATLPGIEFRAVNAAYTESTGTVNPKTEGLVILGGDADVDTFIAKTRSDLNDQRAVQTRMKVKAAVYGFQNAFINGDTAVDANAFDGLKKRLTGGQVIDTATNGLPVVGAGASDQHAFFDKLDELIATVTGDIDGLVMNKAVRAKIRSSARRLGGWDSTIDDFGRTIETYNGIPLLDAGKTAAGADVIPQTETQGSSSVASSIYAVVFGQDESDQAVTGLTNGGVDVREPRRDRRQARVPDPHRVLHRPRRVRQGRRPPAGRPQQLTPTLDGSAGRPQPSQEDQNARHRHHPRRPGEGRPREQEAGQCQPVAIEVRLGGGVDARAGAPRGVPGEAHREGHPDQPQGGGRHHRPLRRLRRTEQGVAMATKKRDKTIDREPGDVGVPMLPGSDDEPVGPEDALGEGPKRGDYSDRLGGDQYRPHEGDVAQAPRVEDVGDAEGLKGGVDTAGT